MDRALVWGRLGGRGGAGSTHRIRLSLNSSNYNLIYGSVCNVEQEWDARLAGGDAIEATTLAALSAEAAGWRTMQDGQRILTTTPSVLGGCRAQVYRVAGATQWYTAVIVGVNEHTGLGGLWLVIPIKTL
ncbi:putative JmjC domain-containing histone demethylation protein 2C [Operophtera brumata]|uniref:Putative JmjC domain-containing histone demethylation protein 2C n=1 Tax=Operophtera brumata TaxID=104452 RepID=A0A0L7KUT6_OPEBR|nr:putative JmjC domain-containing histone demethylation protein 2C [Operophtera brumata]